MAAHQSQLTAEVRTTFGKHTRHLRRQGIVPANIFGHGDSTPIQATAHDLELFLAHGGRTGLVQITVGGEAHTALLKQLTREPKSGKLQHLDFQAVSLTERVTTSVPIRFVGESPAVQELGSGAVLTHAMTELRIEAQAGNLPDAIEVDLSSLAALHDAVRVSDVRPPSGVTLVDPTEEVVAVVLPSAAEESEEAEEAEAPAEAAATAPAEAEAPAEEGEPAAE